MTRLWLTLPLLLVACGEPYSNAPFAEDEAFLAAAPSAARLQLGGPGSLGVAAGALVVVEPAEFYVYTRLTMLYLNGTALRVLHDVDRLLEAAPDARGEGERVWSPPAHALDPLEHRFTMRRDAEGFSYSLEQRPRGSAGEHRATLFGHFAPADQTGHLTVDFDAVAAVQGAPFAGTMHVEYRFEAATTSLELRFDGFDAGDGPLDAVYVFERAPDGGGWFDYGGPGEDGVAWLDVRARWQADGAGRADVWAQAEEGPGFVLSECWGTDFAQVHRAVGLAPGDPEPACAFPEASQPVSSRPAE